MATKNKRKKKRKQNKAKNKELLTTQQTTAEDEQNGANEAAVSDEKAKEAAAKSEKAKQEAAKAAKTKQNKKVEKKNKKPGFFKRIGIFFSEVGTELKKVSWLSSDELTKSTGVVFGIVAFFTLYIWLVDTGLGAIAAALLNLK